MNPSISQSLFLAQGPYDTHTRTHTQQRRQTEPTHKHI